MLGMTQGSQGLGLTLLSCMSLLAPFFSSAKVASTLLTAAAQCKADFPGGSGERSRSESGSCPGPPRQKQEMPRIRPGEKERACHEYLNTCVWLCVCVRVCRMTLCPRETLYPRLPWPGAPVHVTLHTQRELCSPHFFISGGVLSDAVATNPMCLFTFKLTKIK